MSVEDSPEGLRIIMRPQRHVVLIAFLGVWLAGWTFGGLSALGVLLDGGGWPNPVKLFMLFWLSGWTVGEAGVAALVAFLLNGAEIVTINSEQLRHRVEAFGRGLDRVYQVAQASNLRPISTDSGSSRDVIAFDYAEKTVRFGTDLNETSAVEIAEMIWRRLPALRPSTPKPRTSQ